MKCFTANMAGVPKLRDWDSLSQEVKDLEGGLREPPEQRVFRHEDVLKGCLASTGNKEENQTNLFFDMLSSMYSNEEIGRLALRRGEQNTIKKHGNMRLYHYRRINGVTVRRVKE